MMKQTIELDAGQSIKIIFHNAKKKKSSEVIISRYFNDELKIESQGFGE
jgi:hypothetical protein